MSFQANSAIWLQRGADPNLSAFSSTATPARSADTNPGDRRADRLLKGKLRLPQVTRRMDNGHLTPILTSRTDLPAAQLAYRMFERWRQENFFKYLCEEYALDALADPAVVLDDPTREVPNPAWAAADAKLRQAQAHVDRLQAEYGLEALTSLERQRRTMRGFKIAKGKLRLEIWNALQQVMQLEARRDKLPRRVPVQAAIKEPVVKLAPERKHLTNLIQRVAYQAESDLFRVVAPHYRRVDDEGRTWIQSALASSADIHVTDHELRLTLAPMSSAHRTKAVAALCQELNQSETLFPETGQKRKRVSPTEPHVPVLNVNQQ